MSERSKKTTKYILIFIIGLIVGLLLRSIF